MFTKNLKTTDMNKKSGGSGGIKKQVTEEA